MSLEPQPDYGQGNFKISKEDLLKAFRIVDLKELFSANSTIPYLMFDYGNLLLSNSQQPENLKEDEEFIEENMFYSTSSGISRKKTEVESSTTDISHKSNGSNEAQSLMSESIGKNSGSQDGQSSSPQFNKTKDHFERQIQNRNELRGRLVPERKNSDKQQVNLIKKTNSNGSKKGSTGSKKGSTDSNKNGSNDTNKSNRSGQAKNRNSFNWKKGNHKHTGADEQTIQWRKQPAHIQSQSKRNESTKFQNNSPKRDQFLSGMSPFCSSRMMQQISLEERGWFYIDEQQIVQGPYTSIEMDNWYIKGYLSESLLVSFKRTNPRLFTPLKTLKTPNSPPNPEAKAFLSALKQNQHRVYHSLPPVQHAQQHEHLMFKLPFRRREVRHSSILNSTPFAYLKMADLMRKLVRSVESIGGETSSTILPISLIPEQRKKNSEITSLKSNVGLQQFGEESSGQDANILGNSNTQYYDQQTAKKVPSLCLIETKMNQEMIEKNKNKHPESQQAKKTLTAGQKEVIQKLKEQS